MNEYTISVIVSTYSSEAFIRECLQDLTGQTIIDRIEVVVVDACSPQNEKAVVEEYMKVWPNIRYIRTESRVGIYAAWNIAIRSSRGKYIMPFSTNDRLGMNACEVLLRNLQERPDIVLAYGNTYLTDRPHERFEKHERAGAYEWPDYSYEDLLQNCRVGPHPMWRRSVHEEIGYFNEELKALGDYEFWLRLGEKYNMMHVPVFTGLYWVDPGSLSLNKEDSEREIAECREIYQRRYMKRLGCGDAEYRRGLSFIDKKIFNDRTGFVMDTEMGAADILRRYYDGARALVYLHKEDLKWFFDINFVDSEWLHACIAGLHDLVGRSMKEVDAGGETLTAFKSFIRAFGRGMKASYGAHKEGIRTGNDDFDLMIDGIRGDSSSVRKRMYEYNKNFLVAEYMRHLENLGMHLCKKMPVLTGREDLFFRCVQGILAMIAGEALSSYYLYAESLGRLTPEMIRIERITRERVCCHED